MIHLSFVNISPALQQSSSVTATNDVAVTYIGYKCPKEGSKNGKGGKDKVRREGSRSKEKPKRAYIALVEQNK